MLFRPQKYGRALLAFMLVLAVFLVSLDGFFYLREEQKHRHELDERGRHDLALIGSFIAEPMLQQEFGKVEQFLLQWARKSPDVAGLNAYFPSGQLLAEYRREEPAGRIQISAAPIHFEGRQLITLEITKDSSRLDAPLARFKRDLILFSLATTLFIGMVLWFLLRFLAIRPLEQEIVRRQQAEAELQRAHDLLEHRVQERTEELTVAVEDLHGEVVDRKRVEHELAAEKERLVVTLRSIGDGVISTDIEGRVTLLNKVAERLTGWNQEEAVGLPLSEVFRLRDGKSGAVIETPVSKVLKSGQITLLTGHVLLTAKNGVERVIADSAAPIRNEQSEMVGAVLVFRDETEKHRMTEDLFKVKKLESVGVLAGGIAHDFNNILSAILGNIDLAMRLTSDDHGIQGLLESAKKASLRASKLTAQLLTFAKGGEPVKQLAEIGEVIRESADFVLRGSNVRAEYQFADELWSVSVDSGQISQVIQNIILNAAQAMPDGGVVEISCHNIHQENGGEESGSGNFIGIVIRDHGSGIPAKLLESIFDPYFTTKENGHGLGLAVTHSIVVKHGGRISVESVEGQGTTFTIFLPASSNVASAAQPSSLPKKVAGGAKIMIMDDDEMVRSIIQNILTHLGYVAVLAADGAEALRLYQEHLQAGAPIDLTIMDLTIPGGMGGKEAIKELIAMDPAAKVIVASGYSNDPVMANYRDYGFVAMLSKPFDVKELSAEISRVLGV